MRTISTNEALVLTGNWKDIIGKVDYIVDDEIRLKFSIAGGEIMKHFKLEDVATAEDLQYLNENVHDTGYTITKKNNKNSIEQQINNLDDSPFTIDENQNVQVSTRPHQICIEGHLDSSGMSVWVAGNRVINCPMLIIKKEVFDIINDRYGMSERKFHEFHKNWIEKSGYYKKRGDKKYALRVSCYNPDYFKLFEVEDSIIMEMLLNGTIEPLNIYFKPYNKDFLQVPLIFKHIDRQVSDWRVIKHENKNNRKKEPSTLTLEQMFGED